MRYRELLIENFGVHRDRRLVLDPGVQVIYGPNEAGKSTLLSLLREILFRIHPRTPFLQCSGDGPLAARVAFQLKAGQAGWFRRQKGNPDRITGEVEPGRPLDGAAAIAALLDDANPTLYEHIFAFSAHELRQAAESLQTAGLRDVLMGGGFGGLERFRRIDLELQDRMDRLFKPRGNARNPVINDLLPRLARTRDQHRAAQLRPQQFDELHAARQQHDDAVRSLKQELDSQHDRRRELEQLHKALPLWRELASTRAARARIDVSPGVTMALASEFRRCWQLRERLTEQLHEIEEQCLRRDPPEPMTQAEEALLAAADGIVGLQARLPAMTELSLALPELRREHRRLEGMLASATADLAASKVRSISPDHRDETRRLAADFNRLLERRALLRAQCGEVDGPLLRARREFERLGPAQSVEAWKVRSDTARHWRNLKQHQAQLALHQAGRRREIDGRERRLTVALSAPAQSLSTSEFPLRETLDDFRARWDEAAAAAVHAERRLTDSRESLRDSEQELADCEQSSGGDERRQLALLRDRRDAGWRLIQRGGLAGAASDDAALAAEIDEWTAGRPDRLAEMFEAALAETDRLADLALARAEQIAHRDELARKVESERRKCTQRQAECEAAAETFDTLKADWREIWASAGIEPLSPREMLAWSDGVAELDRLRADAAKSDDELTAIDAQIEAFEREFGAVLPGIPLTSPDAVVQAVCECEEAARANEETRRRLLDEIDALEIKSAAVRSEQHEAEHEWSTCEQHLQNLLHELDLPESWDLGVLEGEIQRCDAAAETLRQRDALGEKLHAAEEEWTSFAEGVRDICAAAAPGLPSDDPLAATRELSGRLHAARQRKVQVEQAMRDVAGDQRVRQHTAAELQACDADLRRLCDESGLDRVAELLAAVEGFEQAAQLDERIRGYEQNLVHLLGRDWTDRQEALDCSTASDLAAQMADLDKELARLRAAHDEAVEQRGAIDRQLQSLADATDALARGAELAALHAELASAVDQWAPLALAREVMARARDRFEKEHQPRLLVAVGEIFARITDGEHIEIRRSLGSAGDDHQLLIAGRDGRQRTPAELSDGARAQLYLAVRLAYAADYCARHEPLPLVMDDVLVEFDEDRARRTLEVLAEFAVHAQVVLLTHHWRTVEFWREVSPAAAVIELGQGSSNEADSSPAATPKPGKKPRGRRRKPDPQVEEARLFAES